MSSPILRRAAEQALHSLLYSLNLPSELAEVILDLLTNGELTEDNLIELRNAYIRKQLLRLLREQLAQGKEDHE